MALFIRLRTALRNGRRPDARVAFRAIGLVCATLVVAVALGALGAGGTYAYLNSAASAQPAATLTAGTASLSVLAGPQNLAKIAPGQTRTALFTITNTGHVPLNLAIASISGPTPANGLTATLASSCTGTQYTAGSFGVPTLASGASVTVCMTVKLGLNAPNTAQWVTAPIAVLITGTQA